MKLTFVDIKFVNFWRVFRPMDMSAMMNLGDTSPNINRLQLGHVTKKTSLPKKNSLP